MLSRLMTTHSERVLKYRNTEEAKNLVSTLSQAPGTSSPVSLGCLLKKLSLKKRREGVVLNYGSIMAIWSPEANRFWNLMSTIDSYQLCDLGH